ncbi:MAG: glycosyltransferase family 2 protein [Phycisphaerae bacterium]
MTLVALVIAGGWPAQTWLVLTCLIALIWLLRHRDITRGKREPILSESDARAPAAQSLPRLSVLVAAKDEEANIGACVAGLLRQDHPDFELIAINDRSHDATGAILDELAARDRRLHAIHVRELPAGWFGKNNAMRTGIAQAAGDWLCFTDADCQFDSPRLLTAAARFAQRERVDFLSVLPRLEAGTFWEKVVQPVAGGIMVYWTPPQKVNSPASPVAYANGAFMLMSRDAYERIGGHDAVRATLNEDMHMARRAKQVGVRLRVIRGGDLFRVRMYTGLPQIWRGWSRIFYGCFGTPLKLLASVGIICLASLSPWVTLAATLAAGATGSPLMFAALAAIVAQQSVLWRFYPISGLAAPWAMTYPLGALLCLGMTINALAKVGGATTTTWRGTTYRGGSTPDSAPAAQPTDPPRPRAVEKVAATTTAGMRRAPAAEVETREAV